jgi:hypothetical protein
MTPQVGHPRPRPTHPLRRTVDDMGDNGFDVEQYRRKEIAAAFKILDEARKQFLLQDIKGKLAEQQDEV